MLLERIELFKDNLVASEKSAALVHFRVLDFETGLWHEVSLPESVYAAFASRHARIHLAHVPLQLSKHDHTSECI